MVRPNAARRLTRGSSAGPDRLETATLRRSLRDLVALSAFPAVWVGQHLPQVAASLAEVLCGAVDLDFLHVQVALGAGDTAHEVARTGERWATDREAELLRRALDSWQNLPSGSVPLFADPLSGGTVRVVAIPIGLAGDCGRLAAASRRADFPTEGERLLLGVAANQVAFVLQARQAARAAAERTQLLALSAEVGQALAQEETLRESLQRCAQALVDHLGGAVARIWTLNEAEHVLELQASAGLYRHLDGPHGRVPLGDLTIGLIAQERRPHLTNDVLNDVRMSDRAWAEREGMRAFAGYPLLIGERTVGVVAMFARVPLSETALEAMSSVANGIALGIERRRAEARLREQTEVVETINRIGQLLSAELDQEKLVQAVTDAATDLTGAQFGAFFYNVIDESGESYTLYSVSGVSRDAFAHFPMPRNTAIFEPTFRGESIIRLDDVTLDPRYGRSSPYYGMPAGHVPVRSYLAVPVVSRSGEVLGGLFFGHADPGVFSERAERVIVGIAAQAAVAIDNARLYRQAQTAIQLRDEFLSVASHELRTPLTTLRAHAQFTLRRFQRDGVLDPDRAVRALEAVDERSRHLGALIEQLLDVSRLEAGGLALEPRETDLVALLREVVAGAQARTERHVIDLQAPTELRLELDPLRIEQVLTNLLENAVKYSPEGGSIEIAMSQPSDETVEIAIRDHGIGIPPEQRDRVFERFYRAHAGHRSGVGLGLYIARQIVELHGGELRAEFPEDGGSRFIVRLSRHPAATTES